MPENSGARGGKCLPSEVECDGPEQYMGKARTMGSSFTGCGTGGLPGGFDERGVLTQIALRYACSNLRRWFSGELGHDRGVSAAYSSILGKYQGGGTKGRKFDALIPESNLGPGMVSECLSPARAALAAQSASAAAPAAAPRSSLQPHSCAQPQRHAHNGSSAVQQLRRTVADTLMLQVQTRFWEKFKQRILGRCWKTFNEETRSWEDGLPMFVDGQHIVYVNGIGLCAHCCFKPDEDGNRTDTWPKTPTASRVDIENCGHKFGALPSPPPLSEPHCVRSNSQCFCWCAVFHETVIDSFDKLRDFNAGWEETLQLTIPVYRTSDPNGDYPITVSRTKVTRVGNGYGGCSENETLASAKGACEPLLSAIAQKLCDRYYKPIGPVERATQVKRFPPDERPDDPSYKPKTNLLQADYFRDLSRLRQVTGIVDILPDGVHPETMCFEVKRSFDFVRQSEDGWPVGLQASDKMTPGQLKKVITEGTYVRPAPTEYEATLAIKVEAFFGVSRAAPVGAQAVAAAAVQRPRKRRATANQRTTGPAVTGIKESEYGPSGERAKATAAAAAEVIRRADAERVKIAAVKQAKNAEDARTYSTRVAGGPTALKKHEVVAALKARSTRHTVLAADRAGGKKPMEVLVERLVALLDARGPPLRVDKCEDCQIVEATKGQGENFGYPAGTEPRWCPFCSQSHPGATWL